MLVFTLLWVGWLPTKLMFVDRMLLSNCWLLPLDEIWFFGATRLVGSLLFGWEIFYWDNFVSLLYWIDYSSDFTLGFILEELLWLWVILVFGYNTCFSVESLLLLLIGFILVLLLLGYGWLISVSPLFDPLSLLLPDMLLGWGGKPAV